MLQDTLLGQTPKPVLQGGIGPRNRPYLRDWLAAVRDRDNLSRAYFPQEFGKMGLRLISGVAGFAHSKIVVGLVRLVKSLLHCLIVRIR